MVITLDSELETVLNELARQRGIAPETLILNALRTHIRVATLPEPRDEWERGLRSIATDCGVSLSNEALSREELYD